MKKSSQKKQRVNWLLYSDLAALEFIQENLADPVLRTRVLNILSWHGKHADSCKLGYYALQISSMLCSGAIVAMNTIDFGFKEQFITLASVLVTFVTGLGMLMKLQENWLRYRKCYEKVKSECFLYLESSGKYAGLEVEKRNRLFAEFLETNSIQVNQEWLASEQRQKAAGQPVSRSGQDDEKTDDAVTEYVIMDNAGIDEEEADE